MKQWLLKLMRRRRVRRAPVAMPLQPSPHTGILAELEALKLELAGQETMIEQLKQDLKRQRENEKILIAASTDDALERVLREISLPVAQLHTQLYLQEGEGKTVSPRDIFSVARRLARSLAEAGLVLEHEAGERVEYNPNRHEPVSAEMALQVGDKARVRVPGVSFHERILRKAAVEPAGE